MCVCVCECVHGTRASLRAGERGCDIDDDAYLDKHMGTQLSMSTKDHAAGFLADVLSPGCTKVGISTITMPTMTTAAPKYCAGL